MILDVSQVMGALMHVSEVTPGDCFDAFKIPCIPEHASCNENVHLKLGTIAQTAYD